MNEQDWTRVVDAATRAPSIHNTQPWSFVAGADRLEVHLDAGRALPVLDPTGRQQVLSCGTAVEFARRALLAAGVVADVHLLPDPDAADHLATLAVTGPHEVTAADGDALAAIARRHTVRAAFAPRAVPADLLEELRSQTVAPGVWVKPITREEEQVATVFLIARAEEVEQGDPAYLAELQRWVRTDAGAVDGVPLAALPGGDPADRPSNWLIRDYIAGQRSPHLFRSPADPDAPPPEVEHPAVLLLGTVQDDRRAWLESGRALGRLLLRLTSAGLAASPLTQALDWPATRTRLRTRLSLVGHPQMLLRVGYPTEPDPLVVSGRRPVTEVLRHRPPERTG